MDNTAIKQIKDLINSSSSIGIAAPKNPTMDEMAASLSLYLLLKNANKSVSIASPNDPLVEVSSLVGVDKVKKTLTGEGGSGDLTVSFPYTEGEIEKVSYTLEEGYLNIIVKAAESGMSFDEKDVEFKRGGGKLDLVFVVGSAHLSDMESVFDVDDLDTKIINIDNKPENEQYGDIVLVSAKLSSVSEGVSDLALALGMHIDQDSAQNLLNGITDATANFQSPKTSSLAFEMAALLLKKGATREASVAARRGIKQEEPQVENQRQSRPQTQNQAPRRQEPNRSQDNPQAQSIEDKKAADARKFEEDLQRRVQEEKAREQAAQGSRQPQNDEAADDASGDDAPDDWLTPKVYKGSSEV